MKSLAAGFAAAVAAAVVVMFWLSVEGRAGSQDRSTSGNIEASENIDKRPVRYADPDVPGKEFCQGKEETELCQRYGQDDSEPVDEERAE